MRFIHKHKVINGLFSFISDQDLKMKKTPVETKITLDNHGATLSLNVEGIVITIPMEPIRKELTEIMEVWKHGN